MSAFHLDRLREIMGECGVGDGVDLFGDILDRKFTELGYDSLALLQIVTVVSRETGTRIGDDVVDELTTPRRFLEFVESAPAGR